MTGVPCDVTTTAVVIQSFNPVPVPFPDDVQGPGGDHEIQFSLIFERLYRLPQLWPTLFTWQVITNHEDQTNSLVAPQNGQWSVPDALLGRSCCH